MCTDIIRRAGVPRGDGAGNDVVAARDGEVHGPQEHEEVVGAEVVVRVPVQRDREERPVPRRARI